eukprot:608999-Prymnesium_polylepis.1
MGRARDTWRAALLRDTWRAARLRRTRGAPAPDIVHTWCAAPARELDIKTCVARSAHCPSVNRVPVPACRIKGITNAKNGARVRASINRSTTFETFHSRCARYEALAKSFCFSSFS